MDRERLLNRAPTSEELLGAPDSRRKELAETYIAAILDAFEADRHEPDTWEAAHLSHAIGYIVIARYVLSVDETMCALAPPKERDEMHGEPEQRRSLRDLRHLLRHVGGIAVLTS
jgi:hypothetical protein